MTSSPLLILSSDSVKPAHIAGTTNKPMIVTDTNTVAQTAIKPFTQIST
ncbi:hypothetical protein N9I51_02545 [Gammaproteobacteria bacterium]|nr:hypothetical protein [Gammaproteobacteria bacterium]